MILICSEARITQHLTKKDYDIDNYNVIECFSDKRTTGGVMIYIKKICKYKIILNKSINNMIWFLAIEVWNSEMNGIYAGFYRSPNKSIVIDNALNLLDQFLEMPVNLNKLNVIHRLECLT